MASPKSLDLDAKYGDEEPAPTKPFHYLGQDWHVVCKFNTVAVGRIQAATDENSLGVFIEYVVGLVVPEERAAFAHALADANPSAERLALLSRDLTEAAAAPVPTMSPSDSSGTRKTRASVRRSTAN